MSFVEHEKIDRCQSSRDTEVNSKDMKLMKQSFDLKSKRRAFWSLMEETSWRKSGTFLRSGSLKPSDSKKGTTSSRGPWNRMCPGSSTSLE